MSLLHDDNNIALAIRPVLTGSESMGKISVDTACLILAGLALISCTLTMMTLAVSMGIF